MKQPPAIPNPPQRAKRKPYRKPVIEKIHLVPNEAILASGNKKSESNPHCFLDLGEELPTDW